MRSLIPVLAVIVLAQVPSDLYRKQSPTEACTPGYYPQGPEYCQKANQGIPDAIPCTGSPPPGYYRVGNVCRPVQGRRS